MHGPGFPSCLGKAVSRRSWGVLTSHCWQSAQAGTRGYRKMHS